MINYKKISKHLKKERYESLFFVKSIIGYGLEDIEKSEEKAAYKWWTSHPCFKREQFLEQDLALWSPYPNVQFQRTAIRNTIKIICPVCEEEKDVTDYEAWPY